ncbi:MAG: hypothetical protein MI923_15940 [Phycisphaerales bacterium]|nr:hypothetical protein [Phycisphaerales bacterium]
MNRPDFPTSSARRRIVVVSTTILSLITVDLVIRHYDDELTAFYMNRYERKQQVLNRLSDKPEIILMGSSRVKYGLVPEEFQRVTGRRAFNLGIPASKVIEWQLYAEQCFAEYRPALVVLGINASAIRADYLPMPAATDLFHWEDFATYCKTDGWSDQVAKQYLTREIGSFWAFYHRRYGLKMLLQEQMGFLLPKHAQHAMERRAMVAEPCPNDGYEHPWLKGRQLRNLGIKLEEDGEWVWSAAPPPFSPDAPAITHFERFLAWFNQRGIRVIVAYLPNSPLAEERWRSVEPQMITAIEASCRKHGIDFLPHNPKEIPATNYDYLQELHVGLPLARQISRRIAGHIVSLGLLPTDDESRLAKRTNSGVNVP